MTQTAAWSDCDAGSKTRRAVPVVARADGTEIAFPMLVARGTTAGKTLLVSAGVHGDEFEGMAALWQVFDELDPGSMQGTFVAVPIVNGPAYEAGSRANPHDHQDLARVFNGDRGSTTTERIAHAFTTRFIAHADLYCDLHSAGSFYEIEPLVGYGLVDGPLLQAQRDAAKVFGAELVWGTAPLPGRTLSAARERGVPALYAEVCGSGRCRDEDVARYRYGVTQLMRHLGILAEAPEPFEPRRIIEDRRKNSGFLQIQNRSPVGGFFRARVSVGDQVQRDYVIGHILSPTGKELCTIRSSETGRVLFLRTYPRVKPGDPLVMVLEDPA